MHGVRGLFGRRLRRGMRRLCSQICVSASHFRCLPPSQKGELPFPSYLELRNMSTASSFQARFGDCRAKCGLRCQVRCDFIGRDGYFETARIAVETATRQAFSCPNTFPSLSQLATAPEREANGWLCLSCAELGIPDFVCSAKMTLTDLMANFGKCGDSRTIPKATPERYGKSA